MKPGTFATAINCMDGRVQDLVAAWIKKKVGVDYVDMITEPGADRVLTEEWPTVNDHIRRKILVSVNSHGSRLIALVAHDDCAGNPVTKEVHVEQVLKGLEVLRGWNFGTRILGLWVDHDGVIHVVGDLPAAKPV
ncbi:MAG: carbonic anhydrase [Planctomycetota bacterium]